MVKKALAAQRESKYVEFKENFDPSLTSDCCELAKDLVAIANSGGGIIVVGLDSCGVVVKANLEKVFELDPADLTNKISKYIGGRELSFTIHIIEKDRVQLVAIVIEAAQVPLLFEKPGTYPDSGKGQKTAFGQGTVFFRHGAKSEPGLNLDIEASIERRLESVRKLWMSGVQKVVRAPLIQPQTANLAATIEKGPESVGKVKVVTDRSGTPIGITRDPTAQTIGSFLHETVSEVLFDEINNVLDVNRFLFPGRDRFLLGTDVYYRIYAERQKIRQETGEIEKLYSRGLADYLPFIYWCAMLPDDGIADRLANIILSPRGNESHCLPRIAPLLGNGFSLWLREKFKSKWQNYSQPPAIYWSIEKLPGEIGKADARLIASRMGPSSMVSLPGDKGRLLSDALKDQTYLEEVVTQSCLEVFQGRKDWVSTARDFDYLAHGMNLSERAASLGPKIQEIVGDRLPEVA